MTNLFNSKVGAAVFFVASLFVAWPALAATLTLSINNDACTYILLIVPIFAGMLYLDRWTVFSVATRSIPLGSVFLAYSIGIAILPRLGIAISLSADALLSASMFALVLWWIGTFIFWFGIRASRRFWFPLCLLFGMVPPPKSAIEAVVSFLQYSSATVAHSLFSLASVPVSQAGTILTIPGLTLHVAEECSSIRSSTLLLLTTIVLAYLLLRSRGWRILVIVCAVPLAIAKNALRIWTIAMLGTRIDPGYLTGSFHHHGGIVFFIIALLAILVLLWLGRRWEDKQPAWTAL